MHHQMRPGSLSLLQGSSGTRRERKRELYCQDPLLPSPVQYGPSKLFVCNSCGGAGGLGERGEVTPSLPRLPISNPSCKTAQRTHRTIPSEPVPSSHTLGRGTPFCTEALPETQLPLSLTHILHRMMIP